MAKKNKSTNFWLLMIVFTLLIYGLISLYSASAVESFKKFNTNTYYIIHQVLYGGIIGIFTMFILSKIDYHFWQKYLGILVLVSLALLAAVKIPGLGIEAGGASRWLNLGFSLQPSELAKVVIVFYVAAWVSKKNQTLNDFSLGLLPSLIIIGLYAGLILWQPDFGTMLVLISTAMLMLFAGGINWRYLFWTLVAGFLGLFALIHFEPYRAKRITAFLNPQTDPQGISYHIQQALIGIGAGGLWGYGYGLSRQKHNYLPEVMGDSIFAVLAEEQGFFRVLIVLALFALLALKGFQIAKRAPDLFGKMTAFGLTSWITLQALINIAAIIKLIPLTGIPLPFFSYGSTALIVNLGSIGILMNISKQSQS